MSKRKRLWEIVEAGRKGDSASLIFDVAILTLICFATAAVVMESVAEYGARFRAGFDSFEKLTIVVFSIEYVLRIWSCVEEPKYRHPVFGRIKFAFSPMQLIDGIAIVPFYLTTVGFDFRAIRLLRLVRILRLARLTRYWRSLQMIIRVFHRSASDLLVSVTAIFMLLVIASTLVYAAENAAQPEVFSSIPASMWWGVETITTVGYGEIVPQTTVGKLIASFVSLLGIGLVALPTAILGSAFVFELEQNRKVRTCPHCDQPIEI